MQSLYATPVRFDPGMEVSEHDEEETIVELAKTLRGIAMRTHEDTGHGLRSVHAKSHGLLRGELTVLDNLPTELRHGAFARVATMPVVIRLSTTPGDVLDDKVSTPRGFAVKLFGVEGDRLAGSEDERTQDLVMVNGPALNAANAKAFLKNIKLLAPTTDKAEGLKIAFSAVLRGVEKIVESVGSESGTLKSLGGHPLTNMLGETFFTQVPTLYGPYMAKLSIAPVSAALIALKDQKLDLHDHPNGIRDAVVKHFRDNDAEWEVRVQLCTDFESMPIEDATVVWPEEKSPFVAVARIRVPRQAAWSDTESPKLEDRLFFSPWHCLAAHRPVGSIQRARRLAYTMSSRYRAEINHVDMHEPAAPDL